MDNPIQFILPLSKGGAKSVIGKVLKKLDTRKIPAFLAYVCCV